MKYINNVPNYIIGYVTKLLTKEYISQHDENKIKKIINETINEEHSALKILSIYSLTVNISDINNSFNLIEDISYKRCPTINYYNGYTLQSNDYIYVLCLQGKACIEVFNKESLCTYDISKGDIFTMNYNSNHLVKTNDKNLRLAIIMYTSNFPFIHYKNLVFSEDSFIYNTFSGYKFALVRLFDESDTLLEDIILANGRFYNSDFTKKNKIINIKNLLTKYDINNFNIDYIPKNDSINTSLEIVELSLDNNTIKGISDGTYTKNIYSSDGIKYKLLISYGVICNGD
ncbi:hypothetical protein [Moosepox virus GoldyGopher14]|nr:hypothetical protein [Moosepox virus GoldyGopher14]